MGVGGKRFRPTIMRRDEEVAPFVADLKKNYIFGGICTVAARASIKALAEMKSINLLGVQQICRNSIALEQVLAVIPSIDNDAVQQRLDWVQTYYELLNLPFEALFAFITEHEYLFTSKEYSSLLKVEVPSREIPDDVEQRVSEICGERERAEQAGHRGCCRHSGYCRCNCGGGACRSCCGEVD